MLFALEEAPLEFEGVSVDVADLLELSENGLDLLGGDGEEGVVCDLEAIDLWRSAVEGDLDDYLKIERAFKFNEDL